MLGPNIIRRPAAIGGIVGLLAALALALTGCGTAGEGEASGGTISGTVRVASLSSVPRSTETSESVGIVPASRGATSNWSIDAVDGYEADAVPGEIIVAFEPGIAAAASVRLEAAGVTLQSVRTLSLPGARLYRSPGADPRELAREMAQRPGVRYAQPNYLLHPLQTREPNDTIWVTDRGALWHYDALDLPRVWDITTGSSSTVVAVVDTGILVDPGNPSISHPDLYGKTLAGYDFISDPTIAGDGDGRDASPYDVGDVPGGQSTFHGTHVAGTIGARANDAYGIPGVAWEAQILPVRALGQGGGTMVDIIEGSLWAAGYTVAGVPTNANPADVLNLSLGGAAPCSPYAQDAFDWIATSSPRNAVVVVAAGNDDADAAGYTPAGCRNVITVGASDYLDFRAPYSNYGNRLDVMAPGGDMTVDLNLDGRPDGVLSTWGSAPSGGLPDMTWQLKEGTSMASPHVAGVVALMKALEPDLNFAEAERILVATADPFDAFACDRPLAEDCGAGRVDVLAALAAVEAEAPPNPSDEPLAFLPEPADFGSDLVSVNVNVANTTDRSITWSTPFFAPDPLNPAPLENGWLVVTAATATIPARSSDTVTLEVDRTKVGSDGAFFATLDFLEGWDGSTFDSSSSLSLRLTKDSRSTGLTGPMGVYAFVPDTTDPTGWKPSGFVESSRPFTAFQVEVKAGDNLLVGWVDTNANALVDDGDLLGTYPNLIPILDGSDITGIPLELAEYADVPSSLGAPHATVEAWLASTVRTAAGSAWIKGLLEAR